MCVLSPVHPALATYTMIRAVSSAVMSITNNTADDAIPSVTARKPVTVTLFLLLHMYRLKQLPFVNFGGMLVVL